MLLMLEVMMLAVIPPLPFSTVHQPPEFFHEELLLISHQQPSWYPAPTSSSTTSTSPIPLEPQAKPSPSPQRAQTKASTQRALKAGKTRCIPTPAHSFSASATSRAQLISSSASRARAGTKDVRLG